MFTNPMVNELILKILKHQNITMVMDASEQVYYDLNTGMKSHAHMYIFEDHIVIHRRYGETSTIELDQSFEEIWSDIISAIEKCAHGREYVSYGWARLLEEFYG